MVNGGTINAQYTNIKVTDGAAGIASMEQMEILT